MTLAMTRPAAPTRASADDLLFRKIAWRILPVVFLCYIVAIVDRVNVGFAKLQMMGDLGLTAAAYGLGAGIFFLAYCALEIPSNLVLQRVGARLWLARIMLTWGVITILTGFVHTPAQFYIARIALGAAEAGFYPGVVYFLSQWFPPSRRGRAMATFVIAGPIGSMVVGPVAGWIMGSFEGAYAMHGWQWVFIVTGVPALVMAGVLFVVLRDRPEQAPWLSDGERRQLAQALDAESSARDFGQVGVGRALGDWRAWVAGVGMGTLYLGLYAVVFWTPSIIKSAGVADVKTIGWLSAIPYLCAVVSTLAVGAYADRSGHRKAAVMACAVLGAAGLLYSMTNKGALGPTLGGVAVAAAFFTASLPALLAVVTGLFDSARAAAAGIALVNTLASIGSFLGPYITGLSQERTGSIAPALQFIAAAAVVGGLLVVMMPASRRLAAA